MNLLTLGSITSSMNNGINLEKSKMDMKVSRKKMGAGDYQAKLEKAKVALTALEEKAFASKLDELIKKQNIVSSFKVIQANVREISDVAILTAIGKAVGIKRLVITTTSPRPYVKKSN